MSDPTTTTPEAAGAAGGAPPASMFDEEKAVVELKGEVAPAAEPDTATMTEETKAEVEAGKALQQQHQAVADAQQKAIDDEAKAIAEKALADAQKALEEAKSRGDEIAAVVAMESIRENSRLLETMKAKGPINYTSDLQAVEKEGAKEYIESELVPDPVVVQQVRMSQVEASLRRDKKAGSVSAGLTTKAPA